MTETERNHNMAAKTNARSTSNTKPKSKAVTKTRQETENENEIDNRNGNELENEGEYQNEIEYERKRRGIAVLPKSGSKSKIMLCTKNQLRGWDHSCVPKFGFGAKNIAGGRHLAPMEWAAAAKNQLC